MKKMPTVIEPENWIYFAYQVDIRHCNRSLNAYNNMSIPKNYSLIYYEN